MSPLITPDKTSPIKLDLTGSPIASAFYHSQNSVAAIVGAYGSGKSVACLFKLIRHAFEQPPGKDGIRRTRWAIVRNTNRQLNDTTMKTVFDWFPPSIYGNFNKTEKNYVINKGKFGPLGVEIELNFRALDDPDDVSNLLSLEITGAWINEFRQIEREIFENMIGRTGRFPAEKDGGCKWHGLIMDSNPPDVDSFFYWYFEEYVPNSYLCANDERHGDFTPEDSAEPRCPVCDSANLIPIRDLVKLFRQPSGLSDEAENLNNLPGGVKYYTRMLIGKDEAWKKVYVDGEYGYTRDGKPVHHNYKDSIHVSPKRIIPIPTIPIIVAFDFGRTPACVLAQLTPKGRLNILREFTTEDMGIRQFAREVVKPYLTGHLLSYAVLGTGDPAGEQRGGDDRTAFQEVIDAGIDARPVTTNNHTARRGALDEFLRTMVDGEPAFQLDPSCKVLRKALANGYKYRKMKVVGSDRFEERPEKNHYSHIAEACEYAALYLAEPHRGIKNDSARRTLKVGTKENVKGYF